MKDTNQLTVADLDAAKHGLLNHTNLTPTDLDIAATCIGIVEEMVKCAKPNGEIDIPWINDINFVIDDNGLEVFEIGENNDDANHIVELHNLWLKAVAAFGWEEK